MQPIDRADRASTTGCGAFERFQADMGGSTEAELAAATCEALDFARKVLEAQLQMVRASIGLAEKVQATRTCCTSTDVLSG